MRFGIVGWGVCKNALSDAAVVLLRFAIARKSGAVAKRRGETWRGATTWQGVQTSSANLRPAPGLPSPSVPCAHAPLAAVAAIAKTSSCPQQPHGPLQSRRGGKRTWTRIVAAVSWHHSIPLGARFCNGRIPRPARHGARWARTLRARLGRCAGAARAAFVPAGADAQRRGFRAGRTASLGREARHLPGLSRLRPLGLRPRLAQLCAAHISRRHRAGDGRARGRARGRAWHLARRDSGGGARGGEAARGRGRHPQRCRAGDRKRRARAHPALHRARPAAARLADRGLVPRADIAAALARGRVRLARIRARHISRGLGRRAPFRLGHPDRAGARQGRGQRARSLAAVRRAAAHSGACLARRAVGHSVGSVLRADGAGKTRSRARHRARRRARPVARRACSEERTR